KLASIDTGALEFVPIETPYTNIQYLRASAGQIVFRAGSPTRPSGIVRLDLSHESLGARFEILRRSTNIEIDDGYISPPSALEFPTANGTTAHGFFYEPRNRDYQAPPGERPPLLVYSHGGPTAAAPASLVLGIQYFTSRGIAVLDVNYGGSTGYGRAY